MNILTKSLNILISISILCGFIHAAPKRCKSKNCPAENAFERSCKSYFDCQFAPEGCQQTAWFKCDGSKCLCELFGYLHDELGPMEVEWKEHKCGMSLGGPCGNSSGIAVHCQPGFKCVNAMCEKSTEPEPEKQRCRPEEGCEFGRERPPCHDPKGCEFGHVNKDEPGEFESLEENRPKKRTPNRGGGTGTRATRVSEFEEPSTGKQSGGGGEDWGDTNGGFRFYSYGKQEDKNCGGKECGGEGAGGAEVEPASSSGGSCGDDGCGKPLPPPPKPSCSGGCSKPTRRPPSCGGGGCGRKPRPRPTSPPCDKGCGGGGRKPPKPSCSSCGGGSGGGHKPSSSGGGHCGEDGCGAPPPPPPPPCGGGCSKPKPACGGEQCEDNPPPSCGSGNGGGGCGKQACSGGCPEEFPPPPHNPDAEVSCKQTNSCNDEEEVEEDNPPCDKCGLFKY